MQFGEGQQYQRKIIGDFIKSKHIKVIEVWQGHLDQGAGFRDAIERLEQFMAKKAFITGITGQDGAHLSKHLINDGVQVFGSFRRGSYHKTWRLDELNITKDINLIETQLNEPMNLVNILSEIDPDYIFFHLAGISYISDSYTYQFPTIDANTIGTVNLLEAAKKCCRGAKFFCFKFRNFWKSIPKDYLR